jgi:hypothetical protein
MPGALVTSVSPAMAAEVASVATAKLLDLTQERCGGEVQQAAAGEHDRFHRGDGAARGQRAGGADQHLAGAAQRPHRHG